MQKNLALRTARGFAVLAAITAPLAFFPRPGLAKSSPTPAPTIFATAGSPVSCGLSSTGSTGDNNQVYTTSCSSAISASSALPIIVAMENGQNTISGGGYVLSATITGTGPTNYPYGTILGYSGYGQQGSDNFPGDPVNNNNGDDPFTQGPNVNVYDYAAVTDSGASGYPVGYFLNTGGVVFAASFGSEGFDDDDGSTDHKASNDNYSGTQGGPVTVDLEAGASITAYGDGSNNAVDGQYLSPTLSGIGAFSFGGAGITAQHNDTIYAGLGGNGGAIQVTDDGTVTMTNTNATPTYGIYAVSEGGAGTTNKAASGYYEGQAGNGGAVTVDLNGAISDSAPVGIGILAASRGGSSDFDDRDGGLGANGAGSGGAVTVEIDGAGSIAMSGGAGNTGSANIGILALSAGGNADNGWQGTGGAVKVTLDQGATLTTDGNGNSLSIGVLAISAGSIGDIDPSASSQVNNAYPGSPGDVTVSNSGTISTNGSMAVGVAALSVGGSSIVTNALGTDNNLGDSASTGGFSGQTVNVTNNGSITTDGGAAIGIVALSAGGGGGLLNLQSADQQVADVGSTTGGTAGGNGAAVTVTNSGSVTTGDGNGGGRAAIGIVEQSIGGGGGDSNAPAFFVGGHDPNGDGGGNGGSVTFTGESGSNVTTKDEDAIGILAQSIGGGGGNGANASGIFVAVGGQGGNGGNGGDVTVNTTPSNGTGNVTTLGDFSAGILAQSIGGGGGNGGDSTTVSPLFSVGIGGNGGNGGSGGTVSLYNQGTITTAGNQAHGIIAQSIGGGGGNGGSANAYSAGVLTISVAVGGKGAGGGNAGVVSVTNNFHIYTGCAGALSGCSAASYANTGAPAQTGADSIGILAQSIGGGGGNGGAAKAASLTLPTGDTVPFELGIDVAVGGAAGNASSGNTVTINDAGQIATGGDASYGVLAQSIGGGGGNGGDSTATSDAIQGTAPTGQITLALGGSGGGGGSGGTVNVTLGADSNCGGCNGQIYTFGQNATAILAQSVGGGGGTGATGNAADNAPNLGGNTGTSLNVSVGVGGSGGNGGSGGSVTVTNDAGSTIATFGSGSQGILAQSIGGGGGAAAGGSAAASNDNYDINVSVGGGGGSGNNGGAVTVTNAGSISTGGLYTNAAGYGVITGGDAIGILAQSIGGGGGVGGSSDAAATIDTAGQIEDALNPPGTSWNADVAVGGKGGAGGNGNTINVTNSGILTTRGIRAYGIEAQSIGGGGGNGGAATSSSNSVLGGISTALEEGSGEGEADGVEAESIGGSDGFGPSQGVQVTEKGQTYSADIGIAGSGGASGSGGTITVNNSGTLQTFGYGAHAIFAQSIGGGGGVGGDGTVGDTTTLGIGIQSGGSGGNGGNGSTVTITDSGTIATAGDDAYGILAQSIGGGGGEGGTGCTNSASAGIQGIAASACTGNGNGATLNTAPWNDANDVTMDLGGNNGAYGNGGQVTIGGSSSPLTGPITTYGARAFGIAAQSIGGGGGLAAASSQNIGSIALVTGDAGNGASINVNMAASAPITTYGDGAYGMLLQSIGGGGGFAGDSSLPLATPYSNGIIVNSSSGDTIDGGTVSADLADNITTNGANAIGVFAQSVGGGGGVWSDNGALIAGNAPDASQAGYYGGGGAIVINQTSGSIDTKGAGSIGIFAQSTGNDPSAQDPIDITIGGTVSGGSGSGAGIELSGGRDGNYPGIASPNLVTVSSTGVLGSNAGIFGTAVVSHDSIVSLVNNGSLEGSVDFGPDDNATQTISSTVLNNGVFASGDIVRAATLTNNGTMYVFVPGIIGTTSVTGNFVQGDSGVLNVQINSRASQQADLLAVSGPVVLNGAIVPTGLSALLPGTYGVITAPTFGGQWTIRQPLLFTWILDSVPNVFALSPEQDFAKPNGAPNSLTKDQLSLANYLATAWNNSDPALAATFATLSQIPVGGENELKALADSAYSARATQGETLALKSSEGSILGASMSCPLFSGATTLVTETSCVWARIGGQSIDQYASGGESGFSTTGATYRVGAEREFAPNWFISGSIGENSTWSTEGISSSSGQTYDGSLALKRQMGNWLFTSSLALANGAYRNNRVVELPGVFTALKSDSNAFMIGGKLRAAYAVPFANFYLRPFADLDIININTPSFRENGDAAYALSVRSKDTTNVVISPMFEIGGRANYGNQGYLRAFADLGISILPGNNRTVQAAFADASPADGTFSSTIDSPNVLGNAAIGLQLYRADGFEIRADYNTQIGSNFFAQGGMLKLAYHF